MKTKREPRAANRLNLPADPGLRGLRALVFDEMTKTWTKAHELPSIVVLTKKVQRKYPQSRWHARPKAHFAYYKSAFLTNLRS